MDLATFARELGFAIGDADAHGAGSAAAFLRGPVREAVRHLRHAADQLPVDQADRLRQELDAAEATGAMVAVDPAILRRLLQPAPVVDHAAADCRECPHYPTPAQPDTRRHTHG